MTLRVVGIARSWIGTPYVHQAFSKGAGCDCLGLVRGVWRELLGCEPAEVPPYTPDWNEARREEALWSAATALLVSRDDGPVLPGEVILFRMRSGAVAKHLGVVGSTSPIPTFVHAYSRYGVVESALSEPWRRRIVGRFAFPEGVS